MLNLSILSENYVQALRKIFEDKDWFKYDKDVVEIFQRFCDRMAMLQNDSQRDLILELTRQYLWVPASNYEMYLKIALKCMIEENYKYLKGKNPKTKIIICPLVKNKDSIVKSGTFMAYLCQSILVQMLPVFRENQPLIYLIDDLKSLKCKNVGMVILVDDFIGSGSTALECLSEMKDYISKDKIAIVSLVAQEDGINLLWQNDIKVFCAEKRKKAISDLFSDAEAKNKLKTMKEISKLFQATEDYLLGFESSESLVTMIRTPNNTFPFFWIENKGITGKAPFNRRNMYYPIYQRVNEEAIHEKNK